MEAVEYFIIDAKRLKYTVLDRLTRIHSEKERERERWTIMSDSVVVRNIYRRAHEQIAQMENPFSISDCFSAEGNLFVSVHADRKWEM